MPAAEHAEGIGCAGPILEGPSGYRPGDWLGSGPDRGAYGRLAGPLAGGWSVSAGSGVGEAHVDWTDPGWRLKPW